LIGLGAVALAFGWSRIFPIRPMVVIDRPLTCLLEPDRPGTANRHSWIIRNESSTPLKLRTHFTSGRCGFSLWLGQDQIIAPGGTFVVSLAWTTPSRFNQPFSNHAEVWTNDPERPKLQFKVVGKTDLAP
jgi:hypothetical protein